MTTTPAHINSVSLSSEWLIMCCTVPASAVITASFSPTAPMSTVTAIPVRMNPIWDMEEQAKVRLRFTENRARTAPSSMVIIPAASTIRPKRKSPANT